MSIHAGGNFSFVIPSDGPAFAFGDNDYGQLGLGENLRLRQVRTPTQVPLDNIADVSAGKFHTLYLLQDGRVAASGYVLGDNIYEPAVIHGIENATAVAAGASHSLILLNDGRVLAFGISSDGETGVVTDELVTEPTPVRGIRNGYAVSAGDSMSAVIAGEDGKLIVFGTTVSADRRRPTDIGMRNVSHVSVGGTHILFIQGGEVYGFGDNSHGQLGDGGYDGGSEIPIQAAIAYHQFGGSVSEVSAGGLHSLMLLDDGTVMSCGYGGDGQLGHGNRENVNVPTRIRGIRNAIGIAAGLSHSLVQLADGRVVAFGDGRAGQLGRPRMQFALRPVVVPPPEPAAAAPAAMPLMPPGHYAALCAVAGDAAREDLVRLFDHLAIPYLKNWTVEQLCDALARESWESSSLTAEDLRPLNNACSIDSLRDTEPLTLDAYADIPRRKLILMHTGPEGSGPKFRKCYEIEALRGWLLEKGCNEGGGCPDPGNRFDYRDNPINVSVLAALFAAGNSELESLRREFFAGWRFARVTRAEH